MEEYFYIREHSVTSTRLYLNESLPELKTFDWLIIMGGPMSANDEARYPWLKEEKTLIRDAVNNNKIVLGICLGAQLIANALGARVYRNKHKEIGWFPIWPSEKINTTILKGLFPSKLEVFHWHGETFEIPQGGIPIAHSEACENQGFIIESNVIGLQFHLETTFQSAKALINNTDTELEPALFVQSEREILKYEKRFSIIKSIMYTLLERLENHTLPK